MSQSNVFHYFLGRGIRLAVVVAGHIINILPSSFVWSNSILQLQLVFIAQRCYVYFSVYAVEVLMVVYRTR